MMGSKRYVDLANAVNNSPLQNNRRFIDNSEYYLVSVAVIDALLAGSRNKKDRNVPDDSNVESDGDSNVESDGDSNVEEPIAVMGEVVLGEYDQPGPDAYSKPDEDEEDIAG